MQKPLFAAALVAALVSFGPAASARAETEHISRVVKVAPGGTLRLKTFSGRVRITATNQTGEVVVEAIRQGPADRLKRIKLDVHTEGSTVVVDANVRDHDWLWWSWRNNVVDTDLDIKVPTRTNVDVTTFSAPVTVTGTEGSHRVHGFSSRIRLENVAGPVEAHTFSGAVDLRARSWRDRQDVDIDTFSGSVGLHLPEGARGEVSFKSFSGKLDSDLPLTLRSQNRRTLTAELGQADGRAPRLRLKTFSGSVKIDR